MVDGTKIMVDQTRDGETSDAALVAALVRGEVEPLGQLYRKYGGLVFAVMKRYAQSLPEAEIEELCHEVFLTAIDAAPRFRGTSSVRSWLCGIAVRKGKGRQRRMWIRQGLMARNLPAGTSAAMAERPDLEAQTSARADLAQALKSLPEPQRDVLLMHVVDGLSDREIAVALGISSKTVWTRIHRARRTMREALRKRQGERQ